MKSKSEVNLKGSYKIVVFDDGKIIDYREIDNIITGDGKQVLLDYLAGNRTTYIRELGLGLANTPALSTDTKLYHEVIRKTIEVTEADLANTLVAFYASFGPSEFSGVVEEIGVFDSSRTSDNLLLANFDTEIEDWGILAVRENALFKEGDSSIYWDIDESAAASISLDRTLDLSGLESLDTISMWVYPYYDNALGSLLVELHTDDTNYYYFEAQISSLATSAWNQITCEKQAFYTIGTPSWEDISTIKLTGTAIPGSGVARVAADSMRAIPSDNSLMLSRTVIDPPVTKAPTSEFLTLYTLEFTI